MPEEEGWREGVRGKRGGREEEERTGEALRDVEEFLYLIYAERPAL